MKNFFKKMKSYSFWVALSSAVVVLLNALGRAFGFSIQNKIVEDVILAIASLLVVLGIVNMNAENTTNDAENETQIKSPEKEAGDQETQIKSQEMEAGDQEAETGEKKFEKRTDENEISENKLNKKDE